MTNSSDTDPRENGDAPEDTASGSPESPGASDVSGREELPDEETSEGSLQAS